MESIEARFWSRVNKRGDEECWEWTASLAGGYGQIRSNGLPRKAHRVSYEMYHGHTPSDLCVCHTCDNKKCVNPRHLFLGSRRDNNTDKAQKHRAGKKLTPGAVSEIRELLISGQSSSVVARRFYVALSTVNKIRRRHTWKYLEQRDFCSVHKTT